jgi:hypothetical protein
MNRQVQLFHRLPAFFGGVRPSEQRCLLCSGIKVQSATVKSRIGFSLLLILLSPASLFSQVLNVAQAGVIEGGYGIAPDLIGATSVFVSGNYAYVVGTGDVLEIVDITLPGLPVHKGSLANGAGGASILRSESVFVSGNYAYLTSVGANGLEIVDVSNPALPVHKGSIFDGGGNAPYLSEAWGVYVSGNYAYVASAASNALEIIDVSNPALPVHKGSLLDGGGIAPFLSGVVDVTVSGNYAYVAGTGFLEIVDISNPAMPVHKGSLKDGGGVAPFLGNVYSISLSGNFLYMTDELNNALEIVDVSNPALPVHKGKLMDGGGVAPFLQACFAFTISGNYGYAVTNGGVMEVVDITNPALPVHKTSLTLPISLCRSIDIVGSLAYVTSRQANSVQTVDISNPASPVIKTLINSGSGGPLLKSPENVYVSGNYAYVASYENNALEIIDVTNPNLPVHKGSIVDAGGGVAPFLNEPASVFVSGNYAYVASTLSQALEIVDVTNPATPVHKGSLQNGTAYLASPVSVFVSGTLAFVGCTGGLEIADISNPAAPVHVGSLLNGVGGALLSNVTSIFVLGNYAYLTNSDVNALEIVNVANPAAPVHKGKLVDGAGSAPFLKGAESVYVAGSYAYVASSLSGALEIINVSNPALPVHKGALKDGGGIVPPYLGSAWSVFVSGNYAFVANAGISDGGAGLEVVDVTNPAAPLHQGSLLNLAGGALIDLPRSVFVSGNYVYMTNTGLYQDLDIAYIYSPGITSFAPATGAVGTSVTVTGQNFNTFITASINGIPATITGITATTVTLTIPPGVTTGKITLNYSGQKVLSANNFIVTPTAAPASAIQQTGFSANWSNVGPAGYFLDVSTDNFVTFVNGFNNLSVGNTTTVPISGLQPGTSYQYRLRYTDGSTVSSNSNIVAVLTTPSTPLAISATSVGQTSFIANWTSASGATGYYIDVGSDITFSKNLLASYTNLIVPGVSDTSQFVTGLNSFTTYYYRVRSADATGSSPSSNVITVLTPDATPPAINAPSTPNPTTITSGFTPTFGAIITDNVSVDSAKIFYRGISQGTYKSLSLQGPGGLGGSYSIEAQSDWYDALGLEYYFMAIDEAGNKTVNPVSRVQLITPAISLPALPSGTGQNDYRIVAFPYQLTPDNKVTTVYNGVPWNDNTKAAIWSWDPTLKNGAGQYNQYNGSESGLQTVDPGKGYWVLTSTAVTPQLSDVTAPAYNHDNLFSITLKPKWNEIGNPYPVPVSWDDVITYNQKVNPTALFSPLNVFDGGYKSATGSRFLNAFEGGFVKNMTSSDITIQIPFAGQTNTGGRVAPIGSDISQEAWNVFLHISQDGFTNELGGFGMHPSAQAGPDRFDNFNPPKFLNIPEVNFINSEYPSEAFSNDMVKTQDNYIWQFTPAGNIGSAGLTWSPDFVNSSGKGLFLLDEERISVTDMSHVSQYDFTLTNASRFRIFYGSNIADKITTQEIAAGAPYPNPLNHESRATINLALPDAGGEFQINLQLFNGHGDAVGSLYKVLPTGIHQLELNLDQSSLAAGIYIYKLTITGERSSPFFAGKIVKP